MESPAAPEDFLQQGRPEKGAVHPDPRANTGSGAVYQTRKPVVRDADAAVLACKWKENGKHLH